MRIKRAEKKGPGAAARVASRKCSGLPTLSSILLLNTPLPLISFFMRSPQGRSCRVYPILLVFWKVEIRSMPTEAASPVLLFPSRKSIILVTVIWAGDMRLLGKTKISNIPHSTFPCNLLKTPLPFADEREYMFLTTSHHPLARHGRTGSLSTHGTMVRGPCSKFRMLQLCCDNYYTILYVYLPLF